MISRFCDWLSATHVSQTFQATAWFVPAVQTVHILCVAVVMTSVCLLVFKLLGLTGRKQPLSAMVSSFMPWIWSALSVLLMTGVLLTITEPARELLNLAFRAKMLMVLAIACILAGLQRSLRADPNYWDRSPRRRGGARAIGAASLLLVVNIIIAGRWIAYI